jgi:hypothetical protein
MLSACIPSQPVQDVLSVFRETHGDVPMTLSFVSEFQEASACLVKGKCNFSKSPPEISIQCDLSEGELIDTLIHELAHLVCGYQAEHNEIWEKCSEELHLRLATRHFMRRA